MSEPLRFLFYANADAKSGAGHIMRLLSLAQASVCYHDTNIEIVFVSVNCSQTLQHQISNEGFDFAQLAPNFTSQTLLDLSPDLIFIDDYNISEQQQQAFEQSGAFLVLLDDNTHSKQLMGDLIINAASNALHDEYRSRNEHALLCLGPKYSLLRKEFWQLPQSPLLTRKQILVTLGASDVKNMALPLTEALLKVFANEDGIKICVLLGGLNTSAYERLEALTNTHSTLTVISHSTSVSSLMNNAGLAISAAGGTLNELACTGTPALALVSVDNQKAVLASSEESSWYIAKDIRDFKVYEFDSELADDSLNTIHEICLQSYKLWRDLCKREAMSKVARHKVDGKGPRRVIDKIMVALNQR